MIKHVTRYIFSSLLLICLYVNATAKPSIFQQQSIKLARRGGGGGFHGGGARFNRGGFNRSGDFRRRGGFQRQRVQHRPVNRWQHRRPWNNRYYGGAVYVDGNYWPYYWPATAAVVGTAAATAAASQQQDQQDNDDLQQQVRDLQAEVDELRANKNGNDY